jgi:hypothetical protein
VIIVIAKAVVFIISFLFAVALVQHLVMQDCYSSDEIHTNISTDTMNAFLFRCDRFHYPTKANVTGPSTEIGFDAGTDHLRFGEIPKGSGGKRFLDIGGDSGIRSKYRFYTKGDIAPLVSFSHNDFILGENDTVQVSVEFRSNADTPTGVYTGSITAIRVVPSYFISDLLLGWV